MLQQQTYFNQILLHYLDNKQVNQLRFYLAITVLQQEVCLVRLEKTYLKDLHFSNKKIKTRMKKERNNKMMKNRKARKAHRSTLIQRKLSLKEHLVKLSKRTLTLELLTKK